jgi:hypothetical protein
VSGFGHFSTPVRTPSSRLSNHDGPTSLEPWFRKRPALAPPSREDPSTLWFFKGQTLQMALCGRSRTSIRAMGGAVEPRRYGGTSSADAELPNLRYVDLRESRWKGIGEYWFYGLQRLCRVELPLELETIGDSAFEWNPLLNAVWFPERLKALGTSVFSGCTALKEADFPPGFQTLGRHSFFGCTALKRVELPVKMKRIEPCVFNWCASLEGLVVGDVDKWLYESEVPGSAVGNGVALKELRLIGRRWECVLEDLTHCLSKDARVFGPNFVDHKLGKYSINAE